MRRHTYFPAVSDPFKQTIYSKCKEFLIGIRDQPKNATWKAGGPRDKVANGNLHDDYYLTLSRT